VQITWFDLSCKCFYRRHAECMTTNVPFRSWSRNQDELWVTNINWSTYFIISQMLGRRGNGFVLWTLVKSSDQKLWKGTSSDHGQFSPTRITDPGVKRFYGNYASDYPLITHEKHMPQWDNPTRIPSGRYARLPWKLTGMAVPSVGN